MDIEFDYLHHKDETTFIELLKQNLSHYEEVGSVLASTFRRLENFFEVYSSPGSLYLTVRETTSRRYIGGAGLGPLAGLPASEGIGEIRDLFISKTHRGQGHGAALLSHCLEAAKKENYNRLYLETTPKMKNAQKLFVRFGFRPVTHNSEQKQHDPSDSSGVPCYYMLESLKNPN